MTLGVVVCAAIVGSAVSWIWFAPTKAAAAVVLEPVGDLGPDPFARAVHITEVADFPSTIKAVPAPLDAATGVRTVDGTTPQLYGGLPTDVVCDVDALGRALAGDPSKAAAWASVTGTDVGSIPKTLGEWTPALLTADTWVTTHGYADGTAVPAQTVLQRGTAVLIDAQGVPRVKCASGSPLLAPRLGAGVTVVQPDEGAWQGFRPDGITNIEPGRTVEEFVVVDLETGRPYDQAVGGSLDAGGLTLATDGLGTVSFGADRASVVRSLEQAFGRSDREVAKTYGPGCRTDTLWWGAEDVDGDSLVVEFDDTTGRFLRYVHTNSGPDPTPRYGVATPEGLAAGAPLATVTRIYPEAVRRTTSVGQTRFVTSDGYVFTAALDPGNSEPYIESVAAGSVPCAPASG